MSDLIDGHKVTLETRGIHVSVAVGKHASLPHVARRQGIVKAGLALSGCAWLVTSVVAAPTDLIVMRFGKHSSFLVWWLRVNQAETHKLPRPCHRRGDEGH